MINPTKKSSLFDLHRILFHRARGLSSYNKECVSVPLETAHVKKINPRERTARSWNVEAEYKYSSFAPLLGGFGGKKSIRMAKKMVKGTRICGI